jgi:site-specific recombinase XerD
MEKYSLKLILWKHNPSPIGHHPIYLRIGINGKTRYVSTGRYIHPSAWDAKNERVKDSYKDSEIINAEIGHRKTEAMRGIVGKQIKSVSLSAVDVKGLVKSKVDRHNIFDFADQYKEDMSSKRKSGTLENYRKHLLRLEKFHGSRSLNFEDITSDYLTAYEKYLRKEVDVNYTQKLLIGVRTIFNAARKKKIISHYPFTEFEMPSYEQPIKDYLTLQELGRLEKFVDKTKNDTLKQTGVYFLLGCYCGLRLSDWITFNQDEMVENDWIKLRAKKNGEWVTMPVNTPLKRNLKRIRRVKLTIEEQTMNRKLKEIAKAAHINKRITTHTGRHTFAITICSEHGVPCETCAELMGITIATCARNYYRVTNRKIAKETLAAWAHLT